MTFELFCMHYGCFILLAILIIGLYIALKNFIRNNYDKVGSESIDKFKQLHEQFDEISKEIRMESKGNDAVLQSQITPIAKQVDSLRAGLAAIQGREFENYCRMLLEDSHIITIDELEIADSDYDICVSLGNNRLEDELFQRVQEKAKILINENE